MIYGELDLPNELIEAQENNRLVVFAGAGVSKAKPASLPSFQELVFELTEDDLSKDNTPFEVTLGKLADKGITVHQQVVNIINREMAMKGRGPSNFHCAIPKLFNTLSGNPIRLVTTNFDTYFSDTVPAIAKKYSAPAIPFSKEFEGLVYLHGSIKNKADNLVLTDMDFSRAYITEGWAREFLINLYRQYTVLFIGYSHNDQLVEHLARGMSFRKNSVFAFCQNDSKEIEHWEWLRINPIIYPKGKHEILEECITDWAEDTQADYFHKKEKFSKYIKAGVPDPHTEVDSYLHKYIMQPGFTRIFNKEAKGVSWGDWVLSRGIAEFIHNDVPGDDSIDVLIPWRQQESILGRWLTQLFIEHPDFLARALNSSEGMLSWPLTLEMIRNITSVEVMDKVTLGKLVILLMNNCKSTRIIGQHTQLLEFCLKSEAFDAGLFVLRELLKPRTDLTDPIEYQSNMNYPLPSEFIAYNFSFGMLERIWAEYGHVLMRDYAGRLISICLNALREDHELRLALGNIPGTHASNPEEEVLAVKETKETFGYPRQIIASIATDTLENLRDNGEIESISTANSLLSEDESVLRRIGIHLIALDSSISPEEKLKWLLGHSLLFRHTEYFEVFELITEAFETASNDVITWFIENIKEQAERSRNSASFVEGIIGDYLTNLVAWLDLKFPSNSVIESLSTWVSGKFTGFPVREYPQYPIDIGRSTVDDVFTVLTGTEILNKLSKVEKLQVQLLISAYQKHVKINPISGIEVLEEIAGIEVYENQDLLIKATLLVFASESDTWTEDLLLRLVSSVNAISISDECLLLLMPILQRTKWHIGMPKECLIGTLQVIGKTVDSLEIGPKSLKESQFYNADYALRIIPQLVTDILLSHEKSKLYNDIWESSKKILEDIVSSENEAYQIAKRTLGREFFLLYKLEPKWSLKLLVPLFFPSLSDDSTAQHTWEGFFSIVNERENEMKLLRNGLLEVLDRNLLLNRSEKCPQMILYYFMINNDEELRKAFIQQADDKGLSSFAIFLGTALKKSGNIDFQWKLWVKDYLLDRLVGKRKPIGPFEYMNIVFFITKHPEVYEELEHEMDYYQGPMLNWIDSYVDIVESSGFSERYPLQTSKFIMKMVKQISELQNPKPRFRSLLEKLCKHRESRQYLFPVINLLGKSGVSWAESLYKKISEE